MSDRAPNHILKLRRFAGFTPYNATDRIRDRRRWSKPFLASLLAMFVLKALGVPFWRWGFDVGDQCDGFVVAALLTWNLTPWSKPPDADKDSTSPAAVVREFAGRGRT